MTTTYADRQTERDEFRAMTERLQVEFAGRVPPGAVARYVLRCRDLLLEAGQRHGLVPATEAAARLTLNGRGIAHSGCE